MTFRVEDINNYSEADYTAFFAEMSNERKNKCSAYGSETDKKLCMLGDNLMRRMISEQSGIPACEIEFFTEEKGKLRCKNVPVKFNISHSGSKVICAVSEYETGVDIEINKPHPARTAERFATEKEKKFILEDKVNFIRIWVLKEAYVKCTGEGISCNLKEVEFTINDNNEVTCSDKKIKAELHTEIKGYTAAICIMNGENG